MSLVYYSKLAQDVPRDISKDAATQEGDNTALRQTSPKSNNNGLSTQARYRIYQERMASEPILREQLLAEELGRQVLERLRHRAFARKVTKILLRILDSSEVAWLLEM